jgi:phosphoglucomutase/phosphomannomutase
MKEAVCPARVREAFARIEVPAALRERAEENLARWLEEEAFADARPQLEALIEKGCFDRLFDAFFQDIPFGTGGRRGPVGFGPNRINPFTVATSIEGHAAFLRKRFPGAGLAVVVAFDVRVFNDLRGVYDPGRPNPLLGLSSRDFARIAAEVYAANGIRVWMPPAGTGGAAGGETRYISTPELSFAIRHLRAHGGLNISASHNHPDDNGAKIYNDRGSQEIPPTDERLARIVEATTSARRLPFDEAAQKGLICLLPAEVSKSYLATNAAVSRHPRARSARVVFTPLHGTGYSSAGASLEQAGFRVDLYPDQATPDGTFKNVPFRSPNPEVRESLFGARAAAQSSGADLVLGTDPDADRLGLMAPHQGSWVFLTGNEIGILLAHYLMLGAGSRPAPCPRFAITTVVTTSLFGRIARTAGVHVIDDLGVGFKYIADVLNSIEATGAYRSLRTRLEGFVIGIEESHGYLVTPACRDKDAAGAAVLLAEIASLQKEQGKSLIDYLDEIYRELGYVTNVLVSTVMLGARGFANMQRIQASLRQDPPRQIGGRAVQRLDDRWDEAGPLGKLVSETDRASRDLLTFELDGGVRLTLRPSGTEPKNKIYVEVSGQALGKGASREALEAEKARVAGLAREVARAFTQEMLSRIGVTLPDHAFEISDLVALENKQDFAAKLLPELIERLSRGEQGAALDAWLDGRLKGYGADARLLVAPAVRAYLASAPVAAPVRAWLEAAFERR